MWKITPLVLVAFFITSTQSIAAQRCDTCLRDSNGKIQRSQSAKYQFKKAHPCPSTGSAYGSCPGYVIDHVNPLKRGGQDAPSNMQWQTVDDAKQKDLIE